MEHQEWSKQVKLTESEAIQKAEEALGLPAKMNYTKAPSGDLFVYQCGKQWLPVYQVELSFLDPYAGREFVFVNAKNGNVVNSYNAIADAGTTGTGVTLDGTTVSLNTYESGGQYYLRDTSKPMSGVIETFDANTRTRLPGSDVVDADNVL